MKQKSSFYKDRKTDEGSIFYLTAVTSKEEVRQAKLLIESLLRFGGELGGNPVWLFLEDMAFANEFSGYSNIKFFKLEIDTIIRNYPLSEKVFACAQAEEMASSAAQSLVWLNLDCLIFNPPELFVLGEDYDAAFRPVHIRNIGSLANEPIDGYWLGVYEEIRVREVPYTVESFVDAQTIRPYFNTHCFSINPTLGIMRTWRAYFKSLLLNREFQSNFCQDSRHQLFLHQVVLSALIMKLIDQKRILMLPPEYSYPLLFQDKLPNSKRSTSLNQLVCMVYEDSTLLEGIEIEEPIRSWLEAKRKS